MGNTSGNEEYRETIVATGTENTGRLRPATLGLSLVELQVESSILLGPIGQGQGGSRHEVRRQVLSNFLQRGNSL